MTARQLLADMAPGGATGLTAYRHMLLMRRLEEKAGLLYALGRLPAPCPHAIGREAAYAALADVALRQMPPWTIVTPRHCPALQIPLGREPKDILSDLARAPAEADGALADPVWIHGARAAEIRTVADPREAEPEFLEQPSVIIAESADLAALPRIVPSGSRSLLILFAGKSASADVEAHATARGAALRTLDGSDFYPLRKALAMAFGDAAAGEALVIRIETPEFLGHAAKSDRRRDAEARRTDPLTVLRAQLLATNAASPEHLAELEEAVRREIATAGALYDPSCRP